MRQEMGLIQLYSTTKPNMATDGISTTGCHDESLAFCHCSAEDQQHQQPPCQIKSRVHEQNLQTSNKSTAFVMDDVCRCGEDVCKTMNWAWDVKNLPPQTIVRNETVLFHPNYSQGTSIIRGNAALAPNMIHYWEIKIVHWFSGTDLLVGIGTDAVDLLEHRYKFASVLGLDGQSWGYSYRGMVQHKNVLKYYGKPYARRCIVGVYLDLTRGHLEFYVNRIPHGIAYHNIPVDKNIYPMVCSTSAKSSVRLINASSFQDCLQFRCMKIITKYPQLLDRVQRMPGLVNLCRDVWFMLPKERYQYSKSDHKQKNNFGMHIENDEAADASASDLADQAMDMEDGCIPTGTFVNGSCDVNTIDDHDIDEAIFLSTYNDKPNASSTGGQIDDDDEPVYDDGD